MPNKDLEMGSRSSYEFDVAVRLRGVRYMVEEYESAAPTRLIYTTMDLGLRGPSQSISRKIHLDLI